MKQKFQFNLLTAAVSLACCSNVLAVDPQTVKLAEGVGLTPSLKVVETYDDNFRAVETNEKSSWITTISPTLTLNAAGSKSNYSLSYTASSDTFHSSSKDNNVDHYLQAEAGFAFDARNKLKLSARYDDVEETASDSQNVENDKYTTKKIGGVYAYGADSALMQLEGGAGYEELRYHNTGTLNADKERDTTALRGTFYYRVAPKTRLLLEGRHTDYAYVTNTKLDSTSVAALVGATWEATAKTTGTVKIGRERKDFDQSGLDSASKATWEAGVTWAPLSYSRFSLTTRQGIDEGDNGASTIDSQSVALGWDHDWSKYLRSNVSLSRSNQDYQDIVREDETDTFGVGLTYAMRRWLDVGIGYKYSDKDSDAANESYTRNIYALTVRASL